eukprot:2893642-Pyramimonas_sp.AAC.1
MPHMRARHALANQPQRIRLLFGRTSLLFDPGCEINVVGANASDLVLNRKSSEWTGKEATARAARPRLNVNGAGEGSASCDAHGVTPIACSGQDKCRRIPSLRTSPLAVVLICLLAFALSRLKTGRSSFCFDSGTHGADHARERALEVVRGSGC